MFVPHYSLEDIFEQHASTKATAICLLKTLFVQTHFRNLIYYYTANKQKNLLP